MANKRKEYFRRTRKSRMRDLKPSPTGMISFVCALASVLCFLVSVIKSYQMAGNADFTVGSFCLVGLVLALGAWIMGVMSMKEKDIRPLPPRPGIVLGVILTFALGGMYVYGFI